VKRVPLVRKTPIRNKGVVKRAPKKGQRRRPTGFTEDTKARVRRRSANQCEARAEDCTHKASQFHHRKLRRHGDHRHQNCLHVCLECHATIHSQVEVSYVMGWLVPSHADPEKVPVLRGSG
jgi:hypothetical protein